MTEFKVGDTVTVTSNSRKIVQIDTVRKITPSGLVKVGDVLYKQNGAERVSNKKWSFPRYIRHTTDADRISFETEQLVKDISSIDMRKLSVQQLRLIAEIVKKEGASDRTVVEW